MSATMPTLPVLRARTAGWHRPLLLLAGAMAVLTVFTAAGLLFDDRRLDGMPIWAKPFKFAVSFVIYSVTWAWLFSLQRRARHWGQRLGTILAVASLIEMIVIAGQAARGHRSHFNDTTTLDSALFQVMGATIAVLFIANLVWAILVLRDQSANRANVWALRLGLLVSVTGLALGGLMLAPTPDQMNGTIEGVVGAHSVGVPDGGPGLPLVGWSTTGGDLRIPHFIGMHAMQLLPLLAMLLGALAGRVSALRGEDTRARLVLVAGGGYAGLLALVTWQALRGQPLLQPDGLTTGAAALLAALVAAGTVAAFALSRRPPRAPAQVTRPGMAAAGDAR